MCFIASAGVCVPQCNVTTAPLINPPPQTHTNNSRHYTLKIHHWWSVHAHNSSSFPLIKREMNLWKENESHMICWFISHQMCVSCLASCLLWVDIAFEPVGRDRIFFGWNSFIIFYIHFLFQYVVWNEEWSCRTSLNDFTSTIYVHTLPDSVFTQLHPHYILFSFLPSDITGSIWDQVKTSTKRTQEVHQISRVQTFK